ncbi:hypothetical protein QN277_011784 [Acacia crassicarpa]|uniref:Leucine-rich repeat-containing N-terminal plant-type domain-containing protein n=1 Tax=Acacia crassicarpa TaxID=499986 RepID=A0AAE1TD39_9FABA|nr:hypothetical protein QN277_011784 [Acacia crassicarpa]
MDGSCNIVVFIFVWLLTLSNVDLCICNASSEVQCIPIERDALLKMKRHLSDSSNRLASWSPHENCCNWALVVCHNITGHVLELHLTTPHPFDFIGNDIYETSIAFGGEVHPSLLDLKHLNYLDLSGNDFAYMQIPDFLGLITSLTYLNLSHARFGGSIPLQFWNLSNLVYLDLGGNYNLEGSITHQIGKLSNLQYFDLGGNEFNGSIPHQIGKLSNLQYLDLGGNEFNGSIPHQIGNLSNLQYLNLNGNEFNGSIPHQIGNLSNLINLHLGNGLLSMFVKNLRPILTLSSLQYLELGYVNLSNTFDWLQVLHSLPYLRELHLFGCDFTHHYEPSTLNSSSLVVLDISDSDFVTLLIPRWIFQLKKLVQLQLGDNGFQGSIPEGIQNLTLLQHLDLSYNSLNSSFPNWLYSLSHLKSLILSCNILVGSISSNIGNLTSLVTLDLTRNLLEGPIPVSVGNLCNLKKLAFSDNKGNQQISEILKILSVGCISQELEIFYMSGSHLSGYLTEHIGFLKNLVELDLSHNTIQGPIHSSLGDLVSLKYLDLSYNTIQGPIHSSLGGLASLKYLDLSSNAIQGELPRSLGNLKSLIHLSLGNNTINNSIPISFGNLTSLVYLDLSENQFVGNPFEIMGSLSKLNRLRLGYNLFEGVVQEAHLVNFTQLQVFLAEKNNLTLKVDPNWNPSFQLLYMLSLACWNLGPQFPSWIQSLKSLEYLEISNTKIFNSIPALFLGTMANLVYLNLSHNHIEGDLSNLVINMTISGGVVDLSSNKLNGQLPYVSQNVEYIDLSSNRLSGSIANFLCHKQESKWLRYLNLASNNLSGKMPDCWMKWPDLLTVNLENNHFIGILHTSMASLLELQILNVRNNTFSGNFPSFLKNKTNLISLDLGENQFSGMVPSWVGKRFSSLKILVLRSNKFSGPIPHQICNMSVLQILDLAHNELTGYIPKCVKYLSSMLVINSTLESYISLVSLYHSEFLVETLLLKGRVYDYSTNLGLITSIDFSSNNLSGEIPMEMTRLKGLHYLNLSNNQFIGRIPQNIGNMESIESLDFSRNRLSGEIPSSMSKLSFLNLLDLSYNDLMGKIPTGTQIQSFEASSFVGNDLCGPPLNNNCSSNNSNDKVDKDKEVDDVKGINWFFVSIALGFIVGFWAMVGPVLFSASWRYAYFQFIDRKWYKLQSRCN